MLIVKAYSGNEYGAFISLSISKIAEYLAFKSESGAYRFIKDLENLGFLTKNKNGLTIYYKSRKVISLEEEKEARKQELKEKLNTELKVVNGIQIEFENYKFNRKERIGSPPS